MKRRIIGLLLTAAITFSNLGALPAIAAEITGIDSFEIKKISFDDLDIEAVGEPLEEKDVANESTENTVSIIDSGDCSKPGDGSVTWVLTGTDTDMVLTISGSGAMEDFTRDTIPWSSKRDMITDVVIEGGLTNIGSFAFYCCSNLTSIVIPDSVTSIGIQSFFGCSNLTSIVIPGSVTSIGNNSFNGCSNLTSVTIPDSVRNIGDGVFECCSKLNNVSIPNSVTSIGRSAFNGCSSLISITLSDNLTSIEENTFHNCSSLRDISIPDGVTSIGHYAFRGCTNLTGIVIPDSVISIGSYAFYECSSLTEITIPNGVTSIEECTFSGCINLTKITIPNSVTSIGDVVFVGCTSLKDITIPVNVTSIGYAAFDGCSSLTSIIIPGSVTSIGQDVFRGCNGLKTAGPIGSGCNLEFEWVESIPTWAFYGCDSLTSITIPNSVKSIGRSAFNGCSSLTEITIPNGVTSIGDYSFHYCISLEEVIIPDTVTSVGDSAFNLCSGLTSVIIPGSVVSIGPDAFGSCNGLKTAGPIGSGCNIEFGWENSIPTHAFDGCRNLTKIMIPDSITRIENNAFSACFSLTDIRFYGNAPSFGEESFWCVTATAYYPENDSTWNGTVKRNYGGTITWAPWHVESTIVLSQGECGENVQWTLDSNGLLEIRGIGPMYDFTNSSPGENAPWDSYKTSITDILIGDGVTHIGSAAFFGCSNLESVSIAETVTSIGENAFSGCTALSRVGYGGSQDKWNTVTIENGNEALDGATYTFVNPGGDPGPGGDDFDKFKPVDAKLIQNKTFKFRSMLKGDDSIEYTFDFDDRWVFSDEFTDRYKLMQTSMRVAMAAFGAMDDKGYGPKNIEDMMDSMGFETSEYYSKSSVEYPEPIKEDVHTIGSAIGMKNIKQSDGSFKSIILVAIRGGGYGAEWGGNFEVGSQYNEDSVGFRKAANEVGSRLELFMDINSDYISEDPYIWITGFSRAAATSNLVAADLINGSSQIEGINSENVMAFCFECPRTTTDSNANNEMYGNIISVVNPLDFVPKVPLKHWGFTRYGMTAYLPSYETTKRYVNLKDSMADKYFSLFRENEISVNEMVLLEKKGQASYLDSFCDHMGAMIPRKAYDQICEDTLIDITASLLGNTGSPDWGNAIPSILDILVTASLRPFTTAEVVSLFVKDSKFGPGQNAHFPELCMSWIDSLSGFNQLYDGENSWYRTVLINCPVSITVRDSEGSVVGHIDNDEVEEIENGIVARIDEDGQKTFVLPQDEQYTIDITATKDGEVNYTVTEYNFDSNTTEKVINYKNIEVSAGEELQGSASEVPDEDEAEYTLQYKEDETPILPDEIMSGDEVIEFSVEITTEGNGTLTGGGSYVKGEFAKVTAEPAEGFVFAGWYIGDSCVSTETEYRFAVTEDVQLVAKFTQDQNIQLDKSEMTVKTGREYKLTATFSPDSGQQINWESSDPAVAIVNQDGIVTGLKSGTATVTANVEDSGISASCAVTVIGGSWKKDNTGWWYLWEDGSYPKSEFILIGGVTYYFNPSGYMVTGWRSIDGKWYYFNASGAMMTGWQRLGGVWYYMNTDGAMVTGWQSIGGVWYYFNNSGAMQTGWRQLGGVWYYMNASGAMVTGWQSIGGKWYYFNAGGAMMTGWQQIGDVWYYMNSSGAMVTGWLKLGNTWYYMNASGAMVTGHQQIDGTWYTFSSSGAMQ